MRQDGPVTLSTPGAVVAVCRVHQLKPDASPVGVTAIDKRPVQGQVAVHDLGLSGDVQADRSDHGGRDQAVYAYSQESADVWAERLGRDVVPGLFGENLRTAGVDVDGAVIGERWQVGSAVVLEVTSPRIPCSTFGRHLGQESWPRRFTEVGLPGAYLRVVQRGRLAAGDPVRVVHRPGHGVTVARWFAGGTAQDARALTAAEAEGGWSMGQSLRFFVERALTRA